VGPADRLPPRLCNRPHRNLWRRVTRLQPLSSLINGTNILPPDNCHLIQISYTSYVKKFPTDASRANGPTYRAPRGGEVVHAPGRRLADFLASPTESSRTLQRNGCSCHLSYSHASVVTTLCSFIERGVHLRRLSLFGEKITPFRIMNF
jgi:hypothetical protein